MFAEDFLVVDTAKAPVIQHRSLPDEEKVYKALVLGLRDYLYKCGFKSAVLGLSGGIDSALTAVIAADALGPENVRGVSLPSEFSSQGSLDDARRLAKNLGIQYDVIPIQPPFLAVKEQLKAVFAGRPEDTTEENIQARLRGVILMALSNKFGSLLLTTGNKSELAVGYCTLYGDMCGGLAVLSDVPKTMVYRIAHWVNRAQEFIPRDSITKPPSAELRPNQTDQDSLPPYDVLDEILEQYVVQCRSAAEIIKQGFDEATVRKIVLLIDFNEYKRRQAAPGLKVTSKAFGVGRRIPAVWPPRAARPQTPAANPSLGSAVELSRHELLYENLVLCGRTLMGYLPDGHHGKAIRDRSVLQRGGCAAPVVHPPHDSSRTMGVRL